MLVGMEGQHVSRSSHSASAESPKPAFLPWPVELVDLERRQALSPVRLGVLMLRRFADPETGLWETSTQGVADLLHVGRSTAQKNLRWLEQHQYLHLRDLRGRTVRRQMLFGGFSHPEHTKLGLPPLRWDADFTPAETKRGDDPELSTPVEYSARKTDSGSEKPRSETRATSERTVPPRTYNEPRTNHDHHEPQTHEPEKGISNPNVTNEPRTNEPNERSESADGDLVDNAPQGATLTPVATFQPRRYEHFRVKEFARKLGEEYINSFLALERRHGIKRFERACRMAQVKLQDRTFPLRQKPGAYVRWLLQNGHC